MRRQKRKDTGIEMAVRRRLHAMGLRYRVDHRVLEGSRRRHDVVFTRARVIVDVRGCFWHACPEHGTRPKANADWWEAKLEANVARDRDTERRAAEQGWLLIVVWEHDDPDEAAARIVEAVAFRSG